MGCSISRDCNTIIRTASTGFYLIWPACPLNESKAGMRRKARQMAICSRHARKTNIHGSLRAHLARIEKARGFWLCMQISNV